MWFTKALPLLTSLALLATLAAAQKPLPSSLAQTLHAAQWKKRVLLIGAPNAAQADFQRQKKLLAAVPDQLRERDFLVLEVTLNQLPLGDGLYWEKQFGQPLTQFTVVLIGKDGGVKRLENKPINPADLFATVDKMPMRRQEMRQSKHD